MEWKTWGRFLKNREGRHAIASSAWETSRNTWAGSELPSGLGPWINSMWARSMQGTPGKDRGLLSREGWRRCLDEARTEREGRGSGTQVGWPERSKYDQLRPSAHPPSFTLILDSLFGVCHGPLHESYWLVHVVFDTVDHGSLSPDARGGGSRNRESKKEERESEKRQATWTLFSEGSRRVSPSGPDPGISQLFLFHPVPSPHGPLCAWHSTLCYLTSHPAKNRHWSHPADLPRDSPSVCGEGALPSLLHCQEQHPGTLTRSPPRGTLPPFPCDYLQFPRPWWWSPTQETFLNDFPVSGTVLAPEAHLSRCNYIPWQIHHFIFNKVCQMGNQNKDISCT